MGRKRIKRKLRKCIGGRRENNRTKTKKMRFLLDVLCFKAR
jgi:hypothetical protein